MLCRIRSLIIGNQYGNLTKHWHNTNTGEKKKINIFDLTEQNLSFADTNRDPKKVYKEVSAEQMFSMRFLIDLFLEKSVRDKEVSAAIERFYCTKSQIKITQMKLKNTILKCKKS